MSEPMIEAPPKSVILYDNHDHCPNCGHGNLLRVETMSGDLFSYMCRRCGQQMATAKATGAPVCDVCHKAYLGRVRAACSADCKRTLGAHKRRLKRLGLFMQAWAFLAKHQKVTT